MPRRDITLFDRLKVKNIASYTSERALSRARSLLQLTTR
jgi:hypothetical protein